MLSFFFFWAGGVSWVLIINCCNYSLLRLMNWPCFCLVFLALPWLFCHVLDYSVQHSIMSLFIWYIISSFFFSIFYRLRLINYRDMLNIIYLETAHQFYTTHRIQHFKFLYQSVHKIKKNKHFWYLQKREKWEERSQCQFPIFRVL